MIACLGVGRQRSYPLTDSFCFTVRFLQFYLEFSACLCFLYPLIYFYRQLLSLIKKNKKRERWYRHFFLSFFIYLFFGVTIHTFFFFWEKKKSRMRRETSAVIYELYHTCWWSIHTNLIYFIRAKFLKIFFHKYRCLCLLYDIIFE